MAEPTFEQQLADLQGQLQEAQKNSRVWEWGGSGADQEHWNRVIGEISGQISGLQQGKQSESDIGNIFQQHLGRAPLPYELTGFRDAIKKGVLDPLSLTLFIQSTG